MSQSSDIYDVIQRVKQLTLEASEQERVSPLLLWLLIRQQADYELLLLETEQLPGPGHGMQAG